MKRTLLGLAACLTVFAGLLAWLLGTSSGGAWLLARALGPALSFETFSGALLGDSVLTGLIYRDAELRFSARRLALRWQPLALSGGRLHVQALEGEGLVYEQLAESAGGGEAPALVPPISIQLDLLRVQGARIILPGGEWSIDRLQTAASAISSRVRISDLSAAALGAELTGSATLDLTAGYPYSAQLRWHGDLPEVGQVRASATIDGNAAGLTLDHRIELPFAMRTRGSLSFGGDALSVDLDGDWQDARWPLTGSPALRSPSGQYRLSGPVDALQLKARGGLEVPDSPPLDLELDGRVTGQAVEELRLVAALGEARAEAHGRLVWTPDLHWSASLAAKGLDPSAWAADWPGRIELLATVEGGSGAEGLWSDIALSRLSGTLLDHPVSGRAQARLDATGVSLSQAVLSSGPSGVDLTGRIGWTPRTIWKLDLAATDLDPSLRWPDWPGRLSVGARIAGGLSADGPWSEVVLERLTGRVNDQPVNGRGRFSYRAGSLDLDELALASGPNRLKAQGTAGDPLNLTLDLDAPDLSAAWARLGGTLSIRGTLTGTPKAPQLAAQATGKGLRYDDAKLGALSARALWAAERVDVAVDGQGLSAGGLEAGKLSLTLLGRPEAFETRLAVHTAAPTPITEGPRTAENPQAVSAQARLNGGWKEGLWQGRLDALDLDSPAFGRWSLKTPAAMTLGSEKIEAEGVCLTGTEGRLCASASWTPTAGRLSAEASSLPLALLKPWLPDGSRLEGSATGQAKLELPPAGLSGSAQLDLTAGRLSLALADGQELALPFGAGRARLNAARGALALDANLPLSGEDHIAARISLGRPGADGSRPLSGRVEAGIADLSPTEMLVPDLSEVHGRLTAHLDLDGTLAHPLVSGETRIADGAAKVQALGISLEQVELLGQSEGADRLDIRAGARSGEGRIEAKGWLALDPQRGWPLELSIKGEDVQAARLPEVVATASPDLRVRSKDGTLYLEGVLLVPKADIQIHQPPKSAVSVSADEVLVGAASGPPAAQSPLALGADIELQLGDKVRFSGFGLTGDLEGKLAISAKEGRTLAQGAISVKDGRYKAYGQDLKIERGRLVFAGTPTNPSLDVRATRRSQDDTVTAILSLTGPLREPLAQVSSDPALSQEEALAYLLTGRSLREGGGSGSSVMLSQALITSGLGRSQTILEGVAKGVGLDQLQVQEGATLEQSSLLLGKYLSPDLYVSYALGLFDPQGALVLRYKLTDRLRLEAQSGQHQGADLIYGFERD